MPQARADDAAHQEQCFIQGGKGQSRQRTLAAIVVALDADDCALVEHGWPPRHVVEAQDIAVGVHALEQNAAKAGAQPI
jgi:hypothetical protein